LQRMAAESNAFGPLLDNTLILMLSELGRYPRLNDSQGKDHFPEVPVLIAGSRYGRGEAYGATGRAMESQPVSLTSGRPERSGQIPDINDLGATLLEIAGHDPRVYGYVGRVLPFIAG